MSGISVPNSAIMTIRTVFGTIVNWKQIILREISVEKKVVDDNLTLDD